MRISDTSKTVIHLRVRHKTHASAPETDLVKAGIVDSTKVTWSALQNAASISGLLLTTEALITEIPEKKPAPTADPHHGAGGMDY